MRCDGHHKFLDLATDLSDWADRRLDKAMILGLPWPPLIGKW
jgi:hypothetical protein